MWRNLEKGEIEFTKIGKHRRVKFEDVMVYKKKMKANQKELLIKIMNADEESGLYDTKKWTATLLCEKWRKLEFLSEWYTIAFIQLLLRKGFL